jgi:hypothetical protein
MSDKKFIQKWREEGNTRLRKNADDAAGQATVKLANDLDLESEKKSKRIVAAGAAIIFAGSTLGAEVGHELEQHRVDYSISTTTTLSPPHPFLPAEPLLPNEHNPDERGEADLCRDRIRSFGFRVEYNVACREFVSNQPAGEFEAHQEHLRTLHALPKHRAVLFRLNQLQSVSWRPRSMKSFNSLKTANSRYPIFFENVFGSVTN